MSGGESAAESAAGSAARSAAGSAAGRLLGGDEFSVQAAMGGWRGFIESAAPGIVFVVAYVAWGGFRVPVLASVAVMVVMVAVRLVQRTPPTQALSGAVGVGIGAIWAWRSGDASGYFVPGLWINAAYGAGVLLSMAVGWPVVGVVMGLIRGEGTAWRGRPAQRRRFQWATGILAAMFAFRLVVQVPLYLAGAVAALGTAKLIMGVPLFALTLWGVWLLVRDAKPVQAPQDPPPTTQ